MVSRSVQERTSVKYFSFHHRQATLRLHGSLCKGTDRLPSLAPNASNKHSSWFRPRICPVRRSPVVGACRALHFISWATSARHPLRRLVALWGVESPCRARSELNIGRLIAWLACEPVIPGTGGLILWG